jgi:hypothetical protein
MLPSASRTYGAPTSNSENLPPRTLARVARDVRDLVKSPPEGVRLVLDEETGMPNSLSEILVSCDLIVVVDLFDWIVRSSCRTLAAS